MAVELWRVLNPCSHTDSYLHDTNWDKHVEKRPELEGHLDSVRETVENPDFSIAVDETRIFKYRRGYLRQLFLLAIEQRDPRDGTYFVKTAYFTDSIVPTGKPCGPVQRLFGA